MTSVPLRLRLLGSFQVERFEPNQVGSRKARGLLKLLALGRGQPVSVDRLIDCLWPDELPSRPEEQVSVLVSRLRSVLGADRLPRVEAGYALRADWLDVQALEDLAEEASRRLAAGNVAMARAAAAAALALVRGPLLADEPDAEWLLSERAAVERLVAAARSVGARAALAASDYQAAAELAAGALDADPYDEAALRLLMQAHSAAGRPGSALAAYAQMQGRLREDLGADPAPETQQLHQAILLQQSAAREEPRPEGALPPEPLLPGRAAELAALEAALERAARGRLELIALEGEAGMGKTRLLDVWAQRAARCGALVLRAQCDELERSLPLQPVLDALDMHLRSLPSAEAMAQLLGPEHALLAPMLTASPPSDLPAQADPVGGQTLLFGALAGVLDRIARQQPVALLLDDLHVAGQATLDWLRFVARRPAGPRLLIVGALRPEEELRLPDCTRIVLGPLDVAAVKEIAGAERALELHEKSLGNPLFVVELASAPGDDIPDSLRDAIAARCDRAGPEVASTVRTAALLGPIVDLDLLAAVVNKPALTLLDELEQAAKRRLLKEEGAGFAFRHELVRGVLAGGAGAMRRTLVHREAARSLLQRADADPLQVAYHARLGGDFALAAQAFGRAAERASGRYDHAESLRLLGQAIELDDSAALRLQRTRCHILLGQFEEAERDALAAYEQGGGAPALEAAGWAAYYRRDDAAAQAYARQAVGLAGDSERSACLALLGRALSVVHDLDGSEQALEEAVRIAPDPASRCAASVWLSMLRTWRGRPREGIELALPGLRLHYADITHPISTYAHWFAAYAYCTLGWIEDAWRTLDALEAELDLKRITRFRHRPGNFRAWLLRGLGEFTAANELSQMCLDSQGGEPAAHATLDLADSFLTVGDVNSAARYLARFETVIAANLALRQRLLLRRTYLHACLHLAAERWEAARAGAQAVVAESSELGIPRYRDLGLLLAFRAAVRLGEAVDVAAAYDVLARLPNHGGPEAWLQAAQLAADTGEQRFWELAEAQAQAVAERAGAHADAFRRYAGARLERMTTRGRSG